MVGGGEFEKRWRRWGLGGRGKIELGGEGAGTRGESTVSPPLAASTTAVIY